MKKVFIALMFLMIVSGALAMTTPIRIQTEPGNEVRLTARNFTTGSPIKNYKDNGFADDDGLFETGVYLVLPKSGVEFHVRVYSGDGIKEGRFDISEVSEPLLLDCTGECFSSTYEVVSDEVEEGSTIEVEEIINESVNETIIIENESISEEDSTETSFTGMAIFMNEDGSINWIYPGGIGVVVLLFIISMVFIARRSKKGKGKEAVVGEKKELDDDEKELEDMEKKVKETEEKIKDVKDKKNRRTKIYDAKVKLAKEERELKDLEDSGNETAVEKQEDVVEKAEDKVDDAIEQN